MGKAKLIALIFILICLLSVNQGMWLDEAIGAIAAHKFTYQEIVTKFMLADNHPPLYYLLLKIWTVIFGYSDLAIRTLSIAAGGMCVYLVYKVTPLLVLTNKRKVAYLSSILMATSQFFVYYSQEARMYIFTSLFSLFAIYFYLNTFRRSKQTSLWICFMISLAALMFTDYVPIFLLPLFWIYPILKRHKNRSWWSRFILSHGLLVLLGIFWIPILQKQAESGRWLLANFTAWKSVAGGANLKQALLVWMKFTSGRITFTNKTLYYLFALLVSIPFGYALLRSLRTSRKIPFLFLWLILPLALGFLSSLFFPAFIYFRFVYVFPALAIVISVGVFNVKNKSIKAILITLLLASNVCSLVIYQFDVNLKRERWKEAVSYLESNIEPHAIVLFEFPEPFAPYLWYSNGKLESFGATNSVSASRDATIQKTANLIENRKVVYHFEYLRDLSDPNKYVEDTLISNGFTESKATSEFSGVGKITKWIK